MSPKLPKNDLRIVVVQSGWVFVGQIEELPESVVKITRACCIRRWGTQKGLGQLAIEGPLTSTILDPVGEVRVRRESVLFAIVCEPKSWTRYPL